jgi:N-acetylglucosamine-6-phosphate deacetylase
MIALTASKLYTPIEEIAKPVVFVEDGRIVEIASQATRPVPAGVRVIDFANNILAPGFIDVHIHGGSGHDVMQCSGEGIAAIEQQIAAHGVTSYLPTTVTAPVEETLRALESLAAAIEAAEKPGPVTTGKHTGDERPLRATPRGIHLEGPFLSHTKRGVHPPEDLLKPSVEIFDRFWQAARGRIRIMTIAPELEGAIEVIQEASKRGVCVSMGHSNADLATTRRAVSAGAHHATHTFNGMRPLDHREPGILGEVLTNPNITAELICDGIHLDPTIVKLALQTKGPNGAVLITDATSGTGMPDGRYHLGHFEFEVKDGKAVSDGKLAGSTLTMDRALRNTMRFAELDLQAALRPATLNPARTARLEDIGVLRAGARADFVVLSHTGEVRRTIIAGRGI